ncbi:MAG: glycosyltransferase family 4 protein [Ignavibacteriaceae bacterium]|nr:glycosyltransferase family 4 protein [Ignavibacteriaceae bacterium]
MNILEFCFSNAWGGLEIYVGTFAKQFKKRGHNVVGIVHSDSRLEAEFRNNSIECSSIKQNSKYLDFITAKKIKSYIAERKIDIIHVHQSKDLSTAILIKKILKPCKIFFSQQMDSRYNKKDLFHRWVYKNLDYIVTMTNDMRLNHINHTPVKDSQIYTIYNGIDLERFSLHKSIDKERFLIKNNIPSDKIIIGSVGRLDSLKNQELLVDVAAKLNNEKKYNIHFIIVGDETDSVTGKGYKEKLIAKIKNYGIEDYFSFFRFTDKIEDYFDLMDIFVLPTDKESFGYVLLEAMAKGKPVIASNQGGPKEIISENINGFLFEPKNVFDLAEKLLLLINDANLRRAMGEESKNIVKTKFDVNATIDNYLKFFENTLND